MIHKSVAFIISLLIIIGVSFRAAAVEVSDANLAGHVLDAETGEHMPGCLVKILNTNLVAMTDGSGHYIFRDLVPGSYILEASFMGYSTQRKSVTVVRDHTTEENFSIHPDAFMLDQVVVTSSKTETRRRESPSLVNVLSAKTFLNVGACSLADGLDFQPGVRVENDCQNCGFTQVRINGLDGHYSQILMNYVLYSQPLQGCMALNRFLLI